MGQSSDVCMRGFGQRSLQIDSPLSPGDDAGPASPASPASPRNPFMATGGSIGSIGTVTTILNLPGKYVPSLEPGITKEKGGRRNRLQELHTHHEEKQKKLERILQDREEEVKAQTFLMTQLAG